MDDDIAAQWSHPAYQRSSTRALKSLMCGLISDQSRHVAREGPHRTTGPEGLNGLGYLPPAPGDARDRL